MIEMKLLIGELENPGKISGRLLCFTSRTGATKEELKIEQMVFDHIKLIGEEISKNRGATVSMVEGPGGKNKKGGKRE